MKPLGWCILIRPQVVYFDRPVTPVDLNVTEGGVYTDNLIAPGLRGLGVNQKIQNLFSELNVDNIDYYKLHIHDKNTGDVRSDYKLANIVGALNCVDFENSDLVVDEDDGSIDFIRKLQLKEDLIEESELKILRIAEYLPLIVVHEAVKNAFEKDGVTGINFLKPQELSL